MRNMSIFQQEKKEAEIFEFYAEKGTFFYFFGRAKIFFFLNLSL